MSNIRISPERKSRPNLDDTHTIYIRISQSTPSGDSHIRKSTGLSIKKELWTGIKGEWVSKKHPEHKAYNLKLNSLVSDYTTEYIILEKKESTAPTKSDVFAAVNKKVLSTNFNKFYKERYLSFKKYNQRKGYITTEKHFNAFLNDKTVSFQEITSDMLERFETHLTDLELTPSSIHSNIKRIRATFNHAKAKKVIDASTYPFGKGQYTLPTPTETKVIERLDSTEISTLFKLEYDSNELMYYIHKGFMLSFLTAGTRIEDLMTLKWSNVSNGSIIYNMKKGVTGGTRKAFGINDRIKKVLDGLKHQDQKPDDFLLPLMTKGIEDGDEEIYSKEVGSKTAIYNKYLKKMAGDIGTTKNLTSHLARHSWSALVYEETKDMKLIQDNLGHKNMKTTATYIGKLSTKQNDDVLTSVYDKLI